MSKPHLFPQSLPSWFLIMNENARLTSKDVAELFGFKNRRVVTTDVSRGHFPEPDDSLSRGAAQKRTSVWKKSTILQEIERRKSLTETKE
jgi:hypothetical protein